jgi:HAT1-interacting factor 1
MATETDVKPDADAPELPRTKEKLEELSSAAALQYSLKNFSAAAESYAYASEIQAELNGDMAPENAELLFYYGRALYKVAMSKTDVLGNKVAQEEKKKPKAKPEAGEGSSASANGATKKEETTDSKPYFQLTGDENWDDSEEEEDAEDGEGEAPEDDDFQNAYETFEMARVCYEKQLEALEAGDGADKGKGKAEVSPQARSIKEKIADCHGFLAEISLENERFQDAVFDARKALALQEELHSVEHENVSEAHYWLSLSLELASVHKVREDQTGQVGDGANSTDATNGAEEQEINYELRDEAAKHTELAIASVEARLKKEKTALTSADLTPEEKKEKEAIIKNKTEALGDLKARVSTGPYAKPDTFLTHVSSSN